MRSADCQVPQVTGRAMEATPEALYELFRDWQWTQTQSSVRTLTGLRPQMDVRFCATQEPPAERHRCAAAGSFSDQPCALQSAHRNLVLF